MTLDVTLRHVDVTLRHVIDKNEEQGRQRKRFAMQPHPNSWLISSPKSPKRAFLHKMSTLVRQQQPEDGNSRIKLLFHDTFRSKLGHLEVLPLTKIAKLCDSARNGDFGEAAILAAAFH